MQLTDTHTHIYYHAHSPELEYQIKRCLDNQVSRLFLPNVDVASINLVMDTVSAFPNHFFPMLGLHPCSVQEGFHEDLKKIEDALSTNKVYAIGEIGLDLHWDKSTLPFQQEAFRIQVAWAKKYNLPIVIHCRDAFDELFALLEGMRDDKLRGVFHCFTGDLEQAKKAINLGFYLGIGGVVTFKNAGLDKVVKEIEMKYLVLETDAPYLAPVPFRGKANESSYLKYIAEKVADLHQVSIEEVARITTQNSVDIFGV